MKRVEVGDLVTCKLWQSWDLKWLANTKSSVVDNYTDATLQLRWY